MKTTKRSKMLLSSIAMLLVALVALGSATYAWYAINRTVSADELTVEASKVGGLQISTRETGAKVDSSNASTSEDVWGKAVHFGVTTAVTLDPAAVTVANDGTVSATTGTHEGNSNEVGTITPAAANNGTNTYWIEKTIKVQNTDKAAISAVPTVTWTTAGNTFFRCAVYEIGTSTVTKVADTASAGTSTGVIASPTAIEFTQAGGAKTYKIVVYADGANTNCTSDNANTLDLADSSVVVSFEKP